MDALAATLVPGIVSAVIGGLVLYVLQRFLDSFKLEQNVKIDNLSSRVRTLEAANKQSTEAMMENTRELGRMGGSIQVLATEQKHTAQALADLRKDFRETETRLQDFGRVIRRES